MHQEPEFGSNFQSADRDGVYMVQQYCKSVAYETCDLQLVCNQLETVMRMI